MRIFFCLILFLISSNTFGQVNISCSFEKDTVVIGDEVDFTLSLLIDEQVEVLGVASFFLDSIYSALQSARTQTDTSRPIIPTIADFELISNGGWEDLNDDGYFAAGELNWNKTTSGSSILLEKTFKLKFWDPGDNLVLFPAVAYSINGQQDQTSQEGQLTLFVAPPGDLPTHQDSLKVAPIKNIKHEASNLSDFLIYFIIVGVALLLGLLYWFYSRYSRQQEYLQNQVKEEIYIVPHELALEKLSDLQSKKLWQRGEIKHYQSELTYIIREYLEGRYNILALESTTDEIVKNLSEELTSGEDVTSLKKILQVADLVKFAKAKPDENVHQTFMNEATDFVQRTKSNEESSMTQVNSKSEAESDPVKLTLDHSSSESKIEHQLDQRNSHTEGSSNSMYPEQEVLASYWRRMAANFIDSFFALIFAAILYTPFRFFDDLPELSNVVLASLALLLMLSYYVWLEYSFQKTLGKRIFKLKVVGDKGRPSLKDIIVRNLLKIFILFAGLPVITIFFTKKRKAMYDFAARTYVVSDDTKLRSMDVLDDFNEVS